MPVNDAVQNFLVDSFVAGLAIKAPVQVASTGPLTLSGLQTVNSRLLQVGDRVLVKDQVDPIENGVYIAQTSAWRRAGDFDGNRDVVGGTIVPSFRVSDTELEFWRVTGNPDPLRPAQDAINFAIYFDPSALAEADTLQTVTARGNTTDQGIVVLLGGVDIQADGTLSMRNVAGDLISAQVNATALAPAIALAFAASPNIEAYQFDKPVNVDGEVHIGQRRLAFYRYGDAVSSYIDADGSGNIRLVPVSAELQAGISGAQQLFRYPQLADYSIEHQSLTSTAGAVTWDYEAGQSADLTLTENVTSLTLSNPAPSGQLSQVEIEITQDGTTAYTVAWPAGTIWNGGTPPDLSTLGSVHLISLRSRDGGTTWLGNYGGNYA